MISVVLEHAKVDPTILIGGFVDYLKVMQNLVNPII